MLASSEQKGSVASACTTDLLKKLENEGYAIAPTCIAEEIIEVLGSHLTQDLYAQRNLLALPIVRELATSGTVRTLAEKAPSRRIAEAVRDATPVPFDLSKKNGVPVRAVLGHWLFGYGP